jgi:broad specificity phosphatase PhoE
MGETTKIYLLRHCKPYNSTGSVPQKNCTISAPNNQTLSRLIKELPANSRIIFSPLQRAIETAFLLRDSGFKFKSIEENNYFAEQDLGLLEGLSYKKAWEKLTNLKPHNWAFFPAEYMPECGETFLKMKKRVLTGFKEVLRKSDGSPIIIVSHSGVIRSIVGTSLNLDSNVMLALKFDHFSLSYLEYTPSDNLGGHYQIGFLNRVF